MPFQTHNPRLSDEWTIERVALLLQLDSENILSRSQIANRLADETGSRFSRNAVIGKLARLGAPKKERRPSLSGPKRLQESKTMRPRANHKAAPPIEALQASLRLSLMDLTDVTCKYITSPENSPYEFCGRPMFDRSYCAAHYRICYYEPRNERPDASHRMRRMNRHRFQCEAA